MVTDYIRMNHEQFSTSVNLSSLKKRFLECPVCSELYDEDSRHPRLLPCLHSYCYSCITKLPQYDSIRCPQCRKSVACPGGDVSCFPKDNTRRDLLDFFLVKEEPKKLMCNFCTDGKVATHRCKDCEDFLCEECFAYSHIKMKAFKGHTAIPLTDIMTDAQLDDFRHQGFCTEDGHEKEVLKLYCIHKTCLKPVCMMCAITEHRNHEMRNITSVFDDKKKELLQSADGIKSRINTVENIMKSVQNENNMVNANASQAEREIKAAFDNLRETIKRREDELYESVSLIRLRKEKVLSSQVENAKSFKESCEEACTFLEQAISYRNASAFLQISPSIEKRFEDLIQTEVDEHPHENSKIEFRLKNMDLTLRKKIMN